MEFFPLASAPVENRGVNENNARNISELLQMSAQFVAFYGQIDKAALIGVRL